MKPATRDFSNELAVIDAMTDDEIDFSDAPEIKDFSGFKRGLFYRPEKQAVTIRLDSDVVAWFKAREDKYQTAVNRVLREYMLSHSRKAVERKAG